MLDALVAFAYARAACGDLRRRAATPEVAEFLVDFAPVVNVVTVAYLFYLGGHYTAAALYLLCGLLIAVCSVVVVKNTIGDTEDALSRRGWLCRETALALRLVAVAVPAAIDAVAFGTSRVEMLPWGCLLLAGVLLAWWQTRPLESKTVPAVVAGIIHFRVDSSAARCVAANTVPAAAVASVAETHDVHGSAFALSLAA